MGYYSSVKVVVNKNDWNDFKETIASNNTLDSHDVVSFLNDCEERELDNDVIVLSWECIKWRYSNDVIANFMDWLHRRESEGLPYKFIRTGENWDDIEEEEYFGEDDEYYEDYDRICLNSYIDTIE